MNKHFNSIGEFEKWLRSEYSLTGYVNYSECWGIFSSLGNFERCFEKNYYTELTPKEEDFLRGKILSHNHPFDTTFSIPDVLTWSNLKMKEIRCVRVFWTHSIKSR